MFMGFHYMGNEAGSHSVNGARASQQVWCALVLYEVNTENGEWKFLPSLSIIDRTHMDSGH